MSTYSKEQQDAAQHIVEKAFQVPRHRRLARWEPFDEIRIQAVPRYKTSSLSGDEWRVGYRVELCFKGEVVADRHYTNLRAAQDYLLAFMDESQCPIPDRVIELEKQLCDQPGCRNPAVSRYRLKKLYSLQGEELAPHDYPCLYWYRQFCSVHLQRGDCGLEDSDRNYEVVSGPGPDHHANVQESPAAFGSVVSVTSTKEPEA